MKTSYRILARQLRRISRLLKLADQNQLHWAKVYIETMPNILTNFQGYLNDLINAHVEDSAQFLRKVHNLMTKADSKTSNFLKTAQERCEELIPRCVEVFTKALKEDTLQSLRTFVYKYEDGKRVTEINELLRLMTQINIHALGMKDSLTSKDAKMLNSYVDGINTQRLKFVEAVKSAMGL